MARTFFSKKNKSADKHTSSLIKPRPFLIIGLGISIIIFGVLIYNQYSSLRQLQNQIVIEELALDDAQKNLNIFLDHKANAPKYLRTIEILDAIVPSELCEFRVMHYLDQVLDDYGFVNTSLHCPSVYRTKGLTGVQILISGNGNYGSVRKLVEILNTGQYIFRIDSIDMRRINGSNYSLRVDVDVSTFTKEYMPTRGDPPAWVTRQQQPDETVTPGIDKAPALERTVSGIIDSKDYTFAILKNIRVNEDLGHDDDGYYIVLVNFDFDVENTRETGNRTMRMYSDDLVASLANEGITNVSEAAIFWNDDYNNRSVKYAYTYRDGGFFIADIAGE